MKRVAASFGDVYVAPSPMGLVAAAVGLLLVLIPAVPPLSDVRAVAIVGGVTMLATVVLALPGLSTAACGIAMVETAMAVVHGRTIALAWLEAIVLLGYLLVADLAGSGRGEQRLDVGRLVRDQAVAVGVGVGLVVLVAALSLLRVSGGFGLAMLAVVAAGVAVVALRWLSSD